MFTDDSMSASFRFLFNFSLRQNRIEDYPVAYRVTMGDYIDSNFTAEIIAIQAYIRRRFNAITDPTIFCFENNNQSFLCKGLTNFNEFFGLRFYIKLS